MAREKKQYNRPKLSASLAYYAVFSLWPLLIVIIFFATFLGREDIELYYSSIMLFFGAGFTKHMVLKL